MLLRWVIAAVALLPLRFASWLGGALGSLVFSLARGERRKALRSLDRANMPAEVARASFRHLGRCAFELACVRQIDARFEEIVEWPAADRAVLEQALAAGKGVVFATAHLGSWELLARGFPAHWDPKLRIPRGQVVAAASIVSPKY